MRAPEDEVQLRPARTVAEPRGLLDRLPSDRRPQVLTALRELIDAPDPAPVP